MNRIPKGLYKLTLNNHIYTFEVSDREAVKIFNTTGYLPKDPYVRPRQGKEGILYLIGEKYNIPYDLVIYMHVDGSDYFRNQSGIFQLFDDKFPKKLTGEKENVIRQLISNTEGKSFFDSLSDEEQNLLDDLDIVNNFFDSLTDEEKYLLDIFDKVAVLPDDEKEEEEEETGMLHFFVNGEKKMSINNPYAGLISSQNEITESPVYTAFKSLFVSDKPFVVNIEIYDPSKNIREVLLTDNSEDRIYSKFSNAWKEYIFFILEWNSQYSRLQTFFERTDDVDNYSVYDPVEDKHIPYKEAVYIPYEWVNKEKKYYESGAYICIVVPLKEEDTRKYISLCNFNVHIDYEQPVEQLDYNQHYLDGSSHCVFTPMVDWANNMLYNLDDNCSRKARQRYTNFIKKCNILSENYKNGVENKDFEEICENLNVSIEIKDILDASIFSQKCSKEPYKKFVYINSRIDHVDRYIDISRNAENIFDVDKMKNIHKEKINKCENVYFQGSYEMPWVIYTDEKIYKFVDEGNSTIKDYNNFANLKKYRLDRNTDPIKFDYIYKHACNFSAHVLISKDNTFDETLYDEFDMNKAYMQYESCDYYMGFPSVMQPLVELDNWSVEKCSDFIGYYTVIVKTNECEHKEAFYRLGIYHNNRYIFTSPEIAFFDTLGMKFDFLSGSYCLKPFEFPWLGMSYMNKLENGDLENPIHIGETILKNKLYAKWTGKLHASYKNETFSIFASEKMAGILANKYKVYESYQKNIFEVTNFDNIQTDKRLYIVKFPRKNQSCYSHLAGYITAYCRLNVLKKYFSIPLDDIFGIKLDSLIVKKRESTQSLFDNDKIWKKLGGAKNILSNTGKTIWGASMYDKYDGDLVPIKVDICKHQLLNGQGGSGKSHSILSTRKDVIYCSKQWDLCCDVTNIYGVKSLSLHQLIGINCREYFHDSPHPTCLLIDEISMMEEKEISDIVAKFPYTQIILAGDVEIYGDDVKYYQCNLMNNTNFTDFSKFNIKTFTKSYRCKDEELLKRQIDLRNFMKDTDFDKNNTMRYFWKLFRDRVISVDELKEKYDYKNDTILCSTTTKKHNNHVPQVDFYNKLFPDAKVFRCISHNTNDIRKKLKNSTMERVEENETMITSSPNQRSSEENLDGTNIIKNYFYNEKKDFLKKEPTTDQQKTPKTSKNLYDEKKVYLRGETIIDPPQKQLKLWEKRETRNKFKRQVACSIHSIQGKTIHTPSKIFIDMYQMFDSRQPYTAISRAEYLDQIYLVNNKYDNRRLSKSDHSLHDNKNEKILRREKKRRTQFSATISKDLEEENKKKRRLEEEKKRLCEEENKRRLEEENKKESPLKEENGIRPFYEEDEKRRKCFYSKYPELANMKFN
jgi:hypothetical protein